MRLTLAFLLAIAVAGCGHAASPDQRLAIGRVGPPARSQPIAVSSPAIGPDGAIDPRTSAYGDNMQPALQWTPVLGAAAYAVVLEDPDAPSPKPFVHWLVWNIPARAASLPDGLVGAAQGRNDADGQAAYHGPHPPAGGAHHYHYQVFALDRRLDLAPGADRDALVAAMRGHVLADGQIVGLYAAPASP